MEFYIIVALTSTIEDRGCIRKRDLVAPIKNLPSGYPSQEFNQSSGKRSAIAR